MGTYKYTLPFILFIYFIHTHSNGMEWLKGVWGGNIQQNTSSLRASQSLDDTVVAQMMAGGSLGDSLSASSFEPIPGNQDLNASGSLHQPPATAEETPDESSSDSSDESDDESEETQLLSNNFSSLPPQAAQVLVVQEPPALSPSWKERMKNVWQATSLKLDTKKLAYATTAAGLLVTAGGTFKMLRDGESPLSKEGGMVALGIATTSAGATGILFSKKQEREWPTTTKGMHE
jgi:hypothetical protein